MIKEDLIKIISDELNITLDESKNYTETILNSFKQSFVDNDKLVIKNFGTFKRLNKKKRIGRDPKNGKIYNISERSVINFKPSNNFINKFQTKQIK